MRDARVLAVAVALVSSGCTSEGSSIDVVVGDREPLPSAVDQVELDVTFDDGGHDVTLHYRTPAVYEGDRLRPWSVRIRPRADSHVERVLYTFRASASRGGATVVSTQARLTFLRGADLLLPLLLDPSCVGLTCPAEQTCSRGACRDDRVDPCELRGGGCSGGRSMDAGSEDAPAADADAQPADAGSSCSVDASCDLLTQCGCGAGDKCDLLDVRTGLRECVAAGPVGEGEPCDDDGCVRGLYCTGAVGRGKLCHRFCGSGADCPSGSNCADVVWFDDAGDPHATADTTVCSSVCDPVDGDGCPAGFDCVVGFSSIADRLVPTTECAAYGTAPNGAACDATVHCMRGLQCILVVGSEHRCLTRCDMSQAAACAAVPGTTCHVSEPPLTVRGISWGFCV